MPRIAHVMATSHSHYIAQHGNTRATIVFDDEDRHAYLKLLVGYAEAYRLVQR